MMKKIINYTISRQAANMHREAFQVPCGMKTLHVVMHVPEECCYMGFVILEDPKGHVRLQKLLGHGEQKLAVGADGKETSVGGVPGAVQEGQWNLTLGIFTEYVQQKLGNKEAVIQALLTDEPQDITEPLGPWVWTKDSELALSEENYKWGEAYFTREGWYKGDFHTHTTLSDGKETRKRAMEKAQLMELDFYVPTEHNLMHTGWCGRGLCILPGIEITTDKGHFNMFGITKIPNRLLDMVLHNGEEVIGQYVRETMQEARENGWIVSLNHPFLTIWSWRLKETRLDGFDCVEIVNDPTYMDASQANDRAIRILDALWQDGYLIYGIGGSDSHNLQDEYYEGADTPSIAGDPGTYVYCDGLAPRELMRRVKKGNMYVSRFCRIEPLITIHNQSCLPGDELPGSGNDKTEKLHYRIKITGLSEEPVVRLIKNNKAVFVHATDEGGSYTADITVPVDLKAWTWVRMDVRRKNGEFLGYLNPVYCGKKVHQFETWGELTAAMGEEGND